MLKTVRDQRGEKKRIYHNPMRQRVIYGNIGKTRNHNLSLTFRVEFPAWKHQEDNAGLFHDELLAKTAEKRLSARNRFTTFNQISGLPVKKIAASC